MELKIGPSSRGERAKRRRVQERNDRSHPVRRTVIDDCGVITTARPLEAGDVRSTYPERVHRRIDSPSTRLLPRGGRTTARKFVERGFVEATHARHRVDARAAAVSSRHSRTSSVRPSFKL